jgi:hypothetical protein
MLVQVFEKPGNNSKLVELASEYHVGRLRKTFTVDAIKEAAQKISVSASQAGIRRPSPAFQYTGRFAAILAKLYIESDDTTEGVELSRAGKFHAIQKLPQILECACLSCPGTGYTTRQGIYGVVDHVLRHHPTLFWGDRSSGGKEEFFKIIG